MQKIMINLLILGLAATCLPAQENNAYEFKTNKEVHNLFFELYSEGNYEEAADVLRSNYKRFTENLEANAFNLAITLGHLNQLSEGIEVLNYGLDHGIWYNVLGLQSQIFTRYRQLAAFEELVRRNQAICDSITQFTKAQYRVDLPASYESGKRYPLFIGLHGAGGNIEDFPQAWTSDQIKKECLSLFIQSSQMVARKGFTWSNDMDLSVREIDSVVKIVCDSFEIDKGRIIIGGFSSGGIAAMEYSLLNSLNVKGFIALCPDKPESWTEANIKRCRDLGMTGIILTTELDPRVPMQKEMANELTRLGMRNHLVITPNTGHWIPDDLPEQLNRALKYILNELTSYE